MEVYNNSNNKITSNNDTCSYDEVFMALLPPGFRFIPTDEELVTEYLRKKVLNMPLPYNRIKEVNIYAYSPEQLSAMVGGEKTMYFFSSRERKYAGGKRPDRTAGDGFWKASGKGKRIVSNNGVSIGCKTSLVYYRGTQRQGCNDKTNWLMHEYTLPQQESKPKGFGDKVLDKWVLCRVYHSGKADQEQHIAPSEGSSATQNETALICYQSGSPEPPEFNVSSLLEDIYLPEEALQFLTPPNYDNPSSFGSHPPSHL